MRLRRLDILHGLAVILVLMPWYERSRLPPIAHKTLTYLAVLVASVVTAVLLGLVVARLVERPALALRDRLVPSGES